MNTCGRCRHFRPRSNAEYGDCAVAEAVVAEAKLPGLNSLFMYPHEGTDCRAFEPGKTPKKGEPKRRKKRAHKGIDAMTAPGMGAVEAEDDGD